MDIPFAVQDFLEVFKNYNQFVWPMQIILYLLAIIAVFFAIKKVSFSGKIISIILSFFWLWMGIVYNFIFFTAINKAAYIFGVIFISQGILFLIAGIIQNKLSFDIRPGFYGLAGGTLILFAMIIYPLLGCFFGHVYPSSPTFGLPCPITIFTFGILLWSENKCPKFILIIPFFWSIIGFFAAFSLGIYEDLALLISGLSAAIMILSRNKKQMIYNRAN